MIKSRCRDEDLCAGGLAHVCPMRLGKQGPRAGKAGRQAEVHLNKGPHEGSASLLLHGTLEGELHLSLFHPLTGAHLHTRALIITGSWQGLGVGMWGGCWASNSQASSDLRQHVPRSLGLGPPMQSAKSRS